MPVRVSVDCHARGHHVTLHMLLWASVSGQQFSHRLTIESEVHLWVIWGQACCSPGSLLLLESTLGKPPGHLLRITAGVNVHGQYRNQEKQGRKL
jgi:hypothetical protein